MSHQRMDQYNGTLSGIPRYDGIEFNPVIPDELVVASPGGVASQIHHHIGSMYSPNNSVSDVYAGQGNRYIAGLYGNMYQFGHEAGQAKGYYSDAPDKNYRHSDLNIETPVDGGESTKVEGYSSDIEYIEETLSDKDDRIDSVVITPWIAFILFIFGFVAFSFWTTTLYTFIKTYVHAGTKMTWQIQGMWSLALTVLFVILAYASGVPLLKVELS